MTPHRPLPRAALLPRLWALVPELRLDRCDKKVTQS